MKALPLPQVGAAGNVGVQEISLDNLDSSMKAPVTQSGRAEARRPARGRREEGVTHPS